MIPAEQHRIAETERERIAERVHRLERLGEGPEDAPTVLASATPGWGAPSTPDGGLVAPLVWVGLGTEADLRARDLTGRIALVLGRALDGAHPSIA